MACRIVVFKYYGDPSWYASRWIDDEYDGCDRLDIDDTSTAYDAIEEAKNMPLWADGKPYAGDRVIELSKVRDIAP